MDQHAEFSEVSLDSVSPFNLPLPERAGAGIPNKLRRIIYTASRSVPQLLPFKSDTVRILPDEEFKALYNGWTIPQVHPEVKNISDKLAAANKITIEVGTMIDTLNFFADSSGRSPYIYVRKSFDDSQKVPAEELRDYAIDVRGQVNDLTQSLALGPSLIEENFHRTCKAKAYPVDTDRKRLATRAIIRADALSKFQHAGIANLPKQYEDLVWDFVKNKELKVVCFGTLVELVCEGKIIAATQYNTNEIATTGFTHPVVVKFLDGIRAEYPRVAPQLEPILNEFIQPHGSRLSAQEVSPDVVRQRLEKLSGPTIEEQLKLYFSGDYFRRHMEVIPAEPFLP